MAKLISVVVSVYNEELVLREFYQETGKVLRELPDNWDYELLFVNDGSQDKSLSILRELAEQDKCVKVVNFSRNFGHEAAMIAGIDHASGDGIIGHFGLGFYSAYMVSNNVEIYTKSYKDEPAVKWESDGNATYTLSETEKAERGTKIVMHVADGEEEFLKEARKKMDYPEMPKK